MFELLIEPSTRILYDVPTEVADSPTIIRSALQEIANEAQSRPFGYFITYTRNMYAVAKHVISREYSFFELAEQELALIVGLILYPFDVLRHAAPFISDLAKLSIRVFALPYFILQYGVYNAFSALMMHVDRMITGNIWTSILVPLVQLSTVIAVPIITAFYSIRTAIRNRWYGDAPSHEAISEREYLTAEDPAVSDQYNYFAPILGDQAALPTESREEQVPRRSALEDETSSRKNVLEKLTQNLIEGSGYTK